MNRLLRRSLFVFVLFLLGSYLAFNHIGLTGITSLDYGYSLDDSLLNEFNNGGSLDINLIPNAEYLGSVGIKFTLDPTSVSSALIFRIKNSEQENYSFEEIYSGEKFRNNKFFTFGFPPFDVSKEETINIRIDRHAYLGESDIKIVDTGKNFIVRHKYSLSHLLSNKKELKEFIFLKLDRIINDKKFLFSLLFYFTPLILYLLSFKFYSLNFIAMLRRKFSLSAVNEFFLLDKNKSFPELDGIRGWAILIVFMAHVSPWVASIATNDSAGKAVGEKIFSLLYYLPIFGFTGGTVGVDLFFMLSGFLIFMTITKNSPTFSEFMKGRVFRLLPVHLILMLTFVRGDEIFLFIMNTFFLVSFFPGLLNFNPVTWTLSYEFVFYFTCAFWLILGRQFKIFHSWIFLVFITGAFFMSQYIFPQLIEQFGVKYLDMNRFIAFFFGIALGKLFFQQKNIWQKAEKIFYYGSIPGIAIITIVRYMIGSSEKIHYLNTLENNLVYLFLDIGVFLLLGSMIVSKDHFFKKIFRNRYLRVIGVISYSMYLFHYVWGNYATVGLIDFIYGIPQKQIAFIVFSFMITVLFSVILYHFLEKPYFTNRK